MRAIFLSDVHLRSERDPGYERVIRFLEELAGDINQLFIVGDFFDFWFCGNGAIYPPFEKPIEKIRRLAETGVKVSILEGNHDFMMKPFFCAKGIDVYPGWADLVLDGQRFLISHGDMVDTSNFRYLVLRKILRSKIFFQIQRRIPAGILWKIAAASSSVSKGLTLESEKILARKMETFSLAKFEEGYDAVIIGHCHRPILRQYDVNGRRKTFSSLGDWIEHFSYLLFEDGNFRLSFYKG
jgi:UDP-2,3-diacylglucosamine hydrolase